MNVRRIFRTWHIHRDTAHSPLYSENVPNWASPWEGCVPDHCPVRHWGPQNSPKSTLTLWMQSTPSLQVTTMNDGWMKAGFLCEKFTLQVPRVIDMGYRSVGLTQLIKQSNKLLRGQHVVHLSIELCFYLQECME